MADEAGQDVAGVPGNETARTGRVRWRSTPHLAGWVLAALCVQFFALGLVQAYRDGATYDEPFQVASGVTALMRHQIRVTPEQPPLWPALAAVPVLLARPVVPGGEAWRRGDGGAYASDFMAAQLRAGRLRWVLFADRIIPLLEAVAVGLFCYLLAASLFGQFAGVVSAGIWLTAPVALGLGHLDSRDVPFALMVLATSYALLRYRREPTVRGALALAAVSGLTLLSRPTGLVMIPVVAVVVLTTPTLRARLRLRDTGIALVGAWVVVWVAYRALAPFDRYRHVAPITAAGGVSLSARILTTLPWPHEYAVGLREQRIISSRKVAGFLFGHSWLGSRWWFLPGSIVLKLAVTTILAVFVGATCWFGLERRVRVDATFVLVLPLMVLSAFLYVQAQDIGVRYLLPVLALAFVIAGPIVRALRAGVVARLLFAVLVVFQLVFFWSSVPHSLAWTEPPFRPGYRYASDSNLDWGQDVNLLEHWYHRHPGAVVSYFGGQPTDIPTGPLYAALDKGLGPGWYAISASNLTVYFVPYLFGLVGLRAYCPVTTLGGTILVYHFARAPDPRVRATSAPAAPCPGRYSHLATRRAARVAN